MGGLFPYIVDATYGRTDTTTCSANHTAGSLQACSTPADLLAAVQGQCSVANSSCTVTATFPDLADPCANTYLVLQIHWLCKSCPMSLPNQPGYTLQQGVTATGLVLGSQATLAWAIANCSADTRCTAVTSALQLLGSVTATAASSAGPCDVLYVKSGEGCAAVSGYTFMQGFDSAGNNLSTAAATGTVSDLEAAVGACTADARCVAVNTRLGLKTSLLRLTATNLPGACDGTYVKTAVGGRSASVTQTAIVCADETVTLTCPAGIALSVAAAFFGRSDIGVCTSGSAIPPAAHLRVCHPQAALDVTAAVRQMFCPPGSSVCALSAAAFVPSLAAASYCPGVDKYLHVEYTCGDAVAVAVCEGDTQALACPAGSTPHLSSATYGRGDSTTCSAAGTTAAKRGVCLAVQDVTAAVQAGCDAGGGVFGACNVTASSAALAPALCPGTLTFLKLYYTCRASASVAVCENTTRSLACPTGSGLNVLSAAWDCGGTNTTCSAVSFAGDWQMGPTSVDVTAAVRRQCPDGAAACDVTAQLSSTTAPICGNASTYKLLHLRYTCRPSEQTQVVCAGQSQSLTCPAGRWVRVLSATLGRSDSTTCAAGLNATTLAVCPQVADVASSLRATRCPVGSTSCNVTADALAPPTGICPDLHPFARVVYACSCPTYLGYSFISGLTAAASAGGQQSVSVSGAEVACSSLRTCTAFNSTGYLYTAAVEALDAPTAAAPSSGTCTGTYMKTGEGCVTSTSYTYMQSATLVAALPQPQGACSPRATCLGRPTNARVSRYRRTTS